MGFVYVNIEVGHQEGGDMIGVPDVLVDTGSAHTVLPQSLLIQLHVEPKEIVTIELAGHDKAEWGIGQANIRIAGHHQTWTCPVYFCPNEEFLLGATTLEAFGLMVDPLEAGLLPKPVRARPI